MAKVHNLLQGGWAELNLFLGVRARVVEIRPLEEKLKLGLKQSFFVDEPEEKLQALEGDEYAGPDLDTEMLDAAEEDSSDEGDDWRQAALESSFDSDAEAGEY